MKNTINIVQKITKLARCPNSGGSLSVNIFEDFHWYIYGILFFHAIQSAACVVLSLSFGVVVFADDAVAACCCCCWCLTATAITIYFLTLYSMNAHTMGGALLLYNSLPLSLSLILSRRFYLCYTEYIKYVYEKSDTHSARSVLCCTAKE